MRRVTGRRTMRWALALGVVGASGLLATAPLGMTGAGAQGNLLGYNATTLAIGAQFAFNVPNVVPLPNENIIEEDVPFARTNVGAGPVVDALSAPYYPGDVAADLGSLLAEFGAPPGDPQRPVAGRVQVPGVPGLRQQRLLRRVALQRHPPAAQHLQRRLGRLRRGRRRHGHAVRPGPEPGGELQLRSSSNSASPVDAATSAPPTR